MNQIILKLIIYIFQESVYLGDTHHGIYFSRDMLGGYVFNNLNEIESIKNNDYMYYEGSIVTDLILAFYEIASQYRENIEAMGVCYWGNSIVIHQRYFTYDYK